MLCIRESGKKFTFTHFRTGKVRQCKYYKKGSSALLNFFCGETQ